MGGWGSGRHGGKPLADSARVIDLARLFRRGHVQEGCTGSGNLYWSRGDQPHGSVSYRYDLTHADAAWLKLSYRQQDRDDAWQNREQHVRLSYTLPGFGGRRWWMHCPVRGNRVAKLYLPAFGDVFAGRKAWGIAYQSQRSAPRDRPFDRLFALQRKLGCPPGWESPIWRPKGMWQRTFARHEERYMELDALCSVEAMKLIGLLR